MNRRIFFSNGCNEVTTQAHEFPNGIINTSTNDAGRVLGFESNELLLPVFHYIVFIFNISIYTAEKDTYVRHSMCHVVCARYGGNHHEGFFYVFYVFFSFFSFF